jgi:hypothetical protein
MVRHLFHTYSAHIPAALGNNLAQPIGVNDPSDSRDRSEDHRADFCRVAASDIDPTTMDVVGMREGGALLS